MPPILNAQGLTKRFGATPLFADVAFPVEDGDRIGLIGPNGAGKSTLLAVLAGETEPDAGEVVVRRRARVAYVRQESAFAAGSTVRGLIAEALLRAGVPQEEREGRLREVLGRLGFSDATATGTTAEPPQARPSPQGPRAGAGPAMDAEAAKLSGGWKKRLAIAEALVSAPDVLLLDEPTNHLDMEGIEWLEEMLRAARFACVVVSHDRYFLERVATEVVELNRVYAQGVLRVRGNYSTFLERREETLETQQRVQESLRNRVRTEVEWLRRGPKARATKAKARIDTAQGMIAELRDMESRSVVGSAGLAFTATERQTKRLVVCEDVSVRFPAQRVGTAGASRGAERPDWQGAPEGEREIVRGLNLLITNGMRLGLVGPNGSGKTTVLRLLAGELEPSAGAVERAPALRIVRFSQVRELPQGVTLRRALAPDADAVVYDGRVVHVARYAAKFLFSGDQLNQPVERLSGGERARVLLARLMLEPSDLLLLDEPTNDLDIPTLEVLEQSLQEYTGALVLVTHDRYLLDRVSNVVLGLDGTGRAEMFADYRQWEAWRAEMFADYRQWEAWRADQRAVRQEDGQQRSRNGGGQTAAGGVPEAGSLPASGRKKKLSYLEAREFAGIEERVEAAEERLAAARVHAEAPEIATDAVALTAALEAMEAARAEVDQAYARWAELSEKAVLA